MPTPSRTQRGGFSLCVTPAHRHTVRRRGPIYRTRIPIITNANTQHLFVKLRGYGHDESVPYAWRNECGQMQQSLNIFGGMNVDKCNHH